MNPAAIASLAHLVLVLVVGARVLLRPYREPASRIAWIVVIIALPFVGIVAYILFGEVNIGRGRVERMRAVTRELQTTTAISRTDQAHHRYGELFAGMGQANHYSNTTTTRGLISLK